MEKYVNIQNIPIKDDTNNITHILHSVADITDKKILEISFEIERQRFNALYLHAPFCMGILKGPNHVYEMANHTYLKLINKKSIIGKSIKEIRPETEEQGLIKILNKVYKTGKAFSAHEKLLKLDTKVNGQIIDIYQDILLQPHKDINGNIDGIYFFFMDVTEKVESRKRIEESEKRYRELIENLPVATYSCDAEGHILIYNKAASALWGKEPEIGKDKWCGFWKIYNKDGNPIPFDKRPMAIALKEGRIITDQEVIIERPNGEKVNILPHPVPSLDSNGQVTGAVNVLFDITNLKKVEEKLAKLNKELSDYKYALDESSIVVITDQKGIIIHVNDNFCKISQFSPEELIGQNHSIINSGYHSKEFIKNLWETLRRGEIWKGEFKNKAKDGSTFWLDTIITPFLDERGEPYQYVVTRFDITKSKNAEENIKKQNEELIIQYQEKKIRTAELSLSNKELVKTNTELDRFVYSVSHDLRSPLTSILGLISFIEEDSREPDTLEQVKMIRASINRLDGFIKNILSYSQNNRTGLETQKIPIKKAINEIVDSVRNIKEAKGISFQIDIDEQKPFYSDWQRFNTILKNLISNAIKYHTEEISGRYLKLTGATDNKELKLSISDNGIGIDAAYHEKIFDMFYRLPSTTTGSGFGLYIVKETVEKLHGTIEVQSEIGVGATFIITLKNLKK
ncbi:MAG: PAS domain S-box protein [Flavobacteriaceae bacterium]|nr:PAS domain S-box protein [Flavobacteriaceae bacterium]